MDAIHFTQGATDPLDRFSTGCARFAPLADGYGDTHVSCLHFQAGATIPEPSLTHAAALLVVHGRITITTEHGGRMQFHAGMGAVFADHEPYNLESDIGAVVLIVESTELTAHPHGIFAQDRTSDQTWPNDSAVA
jgi:redox-sensitive bicupin YhaK (pirin superfamily)